MEETGFENDGTDVPELSAAASHPLFPCHEHETQPPALPSVVEESSFENDGTDVPELIAATTHPLFPCHEHESQSPMVQPESLNTGDSLHDSSEQLKEFSSNSLLKQLLEDSIHEPIVAHIFSGKPNRLEGFAALSSLHGRPCLEIDTLIDRVADMLGDIFAALCRLAERGLILFALIGIPCNT